MYDCDDSRDTHRITVLILTVLALIICLITQCETRDKTSKIGIKPEDVDKVAAYADQLTTRRLKEYDSLEGITAIKLVSERLITNDGPTADAINKHFDEKAKIIADAEQDAIQAFQTETIPVEPFSYNPMVIIGGIGMFLFILPGIGNALAVSRDERIKDAECARQIRIKQAEAKIITDRILADPHYDPLKTKK